ncbi:MAG: hypothetical protein BM564_10120 [Bacteroidetes bacterium MedPE-SWsnd-G2]|nr:MAG: hypothetical protein BM564_10120 [Bacteroidetes bacterium MedPE-SWsnd-G2]
MEETKFNFNEEEKDLKDKTVAESKKAVKSDAKGLWESLKVFVRELLDFRDDTDRDSTIEAIKNDIPFKGATAWILICSIFVASVGLNADSTAVVIGAMLISPLMGPILGIGLSIAINDIETLKKSLINFGVMILLSVITAFLFFKFFPLQQSSSELLARTEPDIRDVLIAFFGGLALIIARTKKGTIASVIFGVAIATALMPPLCTVGYGLAFAWNENTVEGLKFATGAMYLFAINTIFIAMATFLVLKLLRFPMLKYANSAKRKMVARVAYLIAIVVMVPAVWTFVNVIKKTNFHKDANSFIQNELEALPHSEYIKKNAFPEYSRVGPSRIVLNTFGLDEVEETTVAVLENRMRTYSALVDTELKFNQNRLKNLDNIKYMEELRSRDSLDLLSQTQRIKFLENKVSALQKFERNQIEMVGLTNEVKALYSNIKEFSYSNVIYSNFEQIDTVSVFAVKWNDSISKEKEIVKNAAALEEWLKVKLSTQLDTIIVRRIK